MLKIIVTRSTQNAVVRTLNGFGLPFTRRSISGVKCVTLTVDVSMLEDVNELIDTLYALPAALTVSTDQ